LITAYEELQCEALVDGINLNADYATVLGSADTRVQLGLTGHYRKRNYVTEDVRSNLRNFLNTLPGFDREKHVRCLLYTAAIAEKELKTIQD
ncbi:MAG: hypothetical protein D3924_20650, partial [Candidatus Electrothrix sp. AR4]|nr:hypothetical protein [Candidatus Electrothrix sp. AR4]